MNSFTPTASKLPNATVRAAHQLMPRLIPSQSVAQAALQGAGASGCPSAPAEVLDLDEAAVRRRWAVLPSTQNPVTAVPERLGDADRPDQQLIAPVGVEVGQV